MKAMICKGVTKRFEERRGESKTALERVELSLEEGGIYALLGRNGAGKTTLLNCLCTKYLPDEGEIFLFEEPAYENEKMLERICFMPDYLESFSLYSVKRILRYAKMFYPKWNDELMERLLATYEIRLSDRYAAMSKGRRTALSMCIGFCSGCDIVLFDEIYSGLDVVARQQFYEILLEEQEKSPRTFILSTHLIEEMTGVFTDIIILDGGKVKVSETVERVREKAYCFHGRAGQENLFASKNILTVHGMETVAEYIVYDDLSQEEKAAYKEHGFEIRPCSLQELVIAISRGEKAHG